MPHTTDALIIACQNNNEALVKEMLESGVDINAYASDLSRTNLDTTALITAVRAKNSRLANTLISAGADVNRPCPVTGRTALHYAFYNNDHHSSGVLRHYGASIEALDHDGKTPIMSLPDASNIAIIALLTEARADISHIADLIALSPDPIATYKTYTFSSREYMRFPLPKLMHLKLKPRDEITNLREAIQNGYLDIVISLVSPENINEKDETGKTPLMSAVEYGVADIADHLISNGADVNMTNPDEEPVLYQAVLNAYPNLIPILIGAGADVNVWVNMKGIIGTRFPLLVATCNYGLLGSVRELVRAPDIDFHACAPDKKAPIVAAAHYGYLDIMRTLLDAGAHPSQEELDTALRYVSRNCHNLETIRFLLGLGANPNVIIMKETALTTVASIFRHMTDSQKQRMISSNFRMLTFAFDAMKVLIHGGADPYMKNANDKSAIDIANEGMPEITEKFLEEYRAYRHRREATVLLASDISTTDSDTAAATPG